MQEKVRGRFVGVGISQYELVQPLQHAVSDVRELRALLKGYEGEPLADATEAEVRAHMKALARSPQDGGALVALWSGHAIPVARNLRLLAKDNDGQTDGIMLHDFALWCAASGAHQVLIIIDACYSGSQLDEAVRTVADIQEQLLAGKVHWAGVLVSCSSVETARDGLFGTKFRTLLRTGPTAAEDAWRWSDRTPFVDGGAVGVALLNAWDSDVQRPRFMQYGSPQPMLPNPLHAPDTVVKHLLLAARGGDSVDNRSWFTGRTAEVDRVVEWVRSGIPGLRVVTGSPGTGKSAVVGRVVSLSNQTERDLLLNTGPAFRHADPGADSIAAAVHARAMDADRVADLLSRQMVRAGLLPAPAGPRRGAAELVGVVSGLKSPPVLVVDGLDEARGESFSIATSLLTKLASHAVVIVSTRQAHRVAGGAPLLTELAPIATLNLDHSGNTDVRDYVTARIGDRVPQSTVDDLSRLPFLTAWMITDQVLSDGGWDPKLSLDAAFDRELAKVPAAKALLTALTWSYGAGFPEAEWIAVARALSGQEFGRADITAVLSELGRHIVQDGEEGTAVFKLTHQTFADHLRPPFAPSRAQVFAPDADVVAQALIGLYRRRLEEGVPPDVPGYLWKYAWRHCGHGGIDALGGLRELAQKYRMLLPDIALAATAAASELTHWGQGELAISPLEEAAGHFRALVPAQRMYLADLAHVLSRLGQRYREAGRLQRAVAPAEESVVRYRELVASTPTTAETLTHKRLAQRIAKASGQGGEKTYVAHLSGALVELSEVYAMLGRRREAFGTAKEAVALVGDGLPLAKAMTCLAARCTESGRRYEAMQRSRQAVELYFALAQTNPVHLADLVSAQVELSRDLLALNRLSEADRITQQAAEISGTLGRHAAFRPQLADAALSLSVAYSMVDRIDESLTAALQAAEIADGLPTHPQVLHNLMRRQRDAGKPQDALETGLRTIEVCLRPENSHRLATLAAALFTLDTVCVSLRRRESAGFGPVAGDRGAVGDGVSRIAFDSRAARVGKRRDPLVSDALDPLTGAPVGRHLDDVRDTIDPQAGSGPHVSDDRGEGAGSIPTDRPPGGNGPPSQSSQAAPTISDEAWDRVIDRYIGPHRATLLMLRAAATLPGDPAAAAWLCQALMHVGASRQATNDVHDIARRHYDSGRPWGWDTEPAWLTVDRKLLATARAWVFARTYAEERALLLEHPELLEEEADVAVTEALFGTSLIEAQVIQTRRRDAQQLGVALAYRPWLLASLADEFIDAPPQRRRELLHTRREELLDKEVIKAIRQNKPAHALLLLADEDIDVLDLVLDAQEEPERATQTLRDLAATASPQALTQAVHALEPHPLAALYQVVARALAGDDRVPDTEQRFQWIHELTFLVPAHPQLIDLIRKLAEEKS